MDDAKDETVREKESTAERPAPCGLPHTGIGLVKYDCGCVGWPPDEDGRALLVYWCDGEGEDMAFGTRNVKEKTHEPLPVTQQHDYMLMMSEASYDRQSAKVLRSELWRMLGPMPVNAAVQTLERAMIQKARMAGDAQAAEMAEAEQKWQDVGEKARELAHAHAHPPTEQADAETPTT